MHHQDPARLRDVIGEVGARLGLRRPAAVGALWTRWPEIVGDDIAANAEPTSIRDGVLRIRTVSASWATEVGYLGDEIARRVNEALKGDLVREVRVWTGPAPIERRAAASPQEGEGAGGGGAPEARTTRPERSPAEALEAARAAWRRRRGGPRSGAAEGPREGAENPSGTGEKPR